MLTLLNDRTYQVTVEKVENVKVGEQSRTIVTGWAVDKMRQASVGGSRHGCDGIAEYSC